GRREFRNLADLPIRGMSVFADDNGTPVARRVRKATGPTRSAGLPNHHPKVRLMRQFALGRGVKRKLRGLRKASQCTPDGDGRRHVGGWLCRTKADRTRLTDMSPAVRRARLLAGLFCGVGVLALVPWLGWGPLAVFALVPGPLL